MIVTFSRKQESAGMESAQPRIVDADWGRAQDLSKVTSIREYTLFRGHAMEKQIAVVSYWLGIVCALLTIVFRALAAIGISGQDLGTRRRRAHFLYTPFCAAAFCYSSYRLPRARSASGIPASPDTEQPIWRSFRAYTDRQHTGHLSTVEARFPHLARRLPYGSALSHRKI